MSATYTPLVGTKNFPVQEALDASGGSIPSLYRANAQQVLEFLQAVRDYITQRTGREHPITITSLYRTAEHNAGTAGAAKDSQHMQALAADFDVDGLTNHEATALILQGQAAGAIPAFHQVITYEIDHHVHVGLAAGPWRADLQALVKTKAGEYVALTTQLLTQLVGQATTFAAGLSPVATAVIAAVGLGILGAIVARRFLA